MNVNDTREDELAPKDMLAAMFEKQRALMEKYEAIEKQNGQLQTDKIPVDHHSREGQARLKDFAWRVTEELGESTAALEDHPENVTHYREELMDAMHFLIEMSILSGLCSLDFSLSQNTSDDGLRELVFIFEKEITELSNKHGYRLAPQLMTYAVVHYLGRAMNCLKNKPWKTTHMLTDIATFNIYMMEAFHAMVCLCVHAGMSAEDIYGMYTRKNKVNLFRQESNY